MIHIKKSKGKQFRVVITGRNGEVLCNSESLKTKRSAWKNIAATAKQFPLANEDEVEMLTVMDESITPKAKKFLNINTGGVVKY